MHYCVVAAKGERYIAPTVQGDTELTLTLFRMLAVGAEYICVLPLDGHGDPAYEPIIKWEKYIA